MARGLQAQVVGQSLAIVVNVADDDDVYGVRVCPDLDTVTYTLVGQEGPHGWGLAGDTFTVMEHLDAIGVDTTFRLGDRDLAHCLHRSARLGQGEPLSATTAELTGRLGVAPRLLPATDEPLRTWLQIADRSWIPFQEYFVHRRHEDDVRAVVFEGAMAARPAPGVVDAIAGADVVVIAPSNPVLSIWPILAVAGIRRAVEEHHNVVAVSPLFGGKPLRGPADRLLVSQGLPPGNEGVLAAYEGLLTDLVVDVGDRDDAARLADDVRIHVADTRIGDAAAGSALAATLLDIAGGGQP